MKILNLTQHKATDSQKKDGVEDMPIFERELLTDFLTFNEPPPTSEINVSVGAILKLIREYETKNGKVDAVMIGGALFLILPLYVALKDRGYKVLTSFIKRESVEKFMPDGSVSKTSIFNHVGFVELDELKHDL